MTTPNETSNVVDINERMREQESVQRRFAAPTDRVDDDHRGATGKSARGEQEHEVPQPPGHGLVLVAHQ